MLGHIFTAQIVWWVGSTGSVLLLAFPSSSALLNSSSVCYHGSEMSWLQFYKSLKENKLIDVIPLPPPTLWHMEAHLSQSNLPSQFSPEPTSIGCRLVSCKMSPTCCLEVCIAKLACISGFSLSVVLCILVGKISGIHPPQSDGLFCWKDTHLLELFRGCCCLVAKLWPTLCNLINCSLLSSSVHGISQARVLEWVPTSFSRGYSEPRDQTWVSWIGRRIPYHWATWEAPYLGVALWPWWKAGWQLVRWLLGKWKRAWIPDPFEGNILLKDEKETWEQKTTCLRILLGRINWMQNSAVPVRCQVWKQNWQKWVLGIIQVMALPGRCRLCSGGEDLKSLGIDP